MSSGSIRIIQLPEKSSVNTDDYMAVDSSANGTKKVKFTDLLDDNLSVSNKAADAQATGEAINNISARVDNMINTQTNESVTTLWTGTLENKNQSVTLSESIANFDFIDVYVESVDSQFIRRHVANTINIEIQTQNMSDDASVQFLRWWETGLTISGTTATITKCIKCYWDDFSSQPVVSQATNGATIRRIDGVKIGHIENDEIVDARVGANDTTYPTLGDAIRGQVTDLKSEISEITGVNKITEWTDGGYIFTGRSTGETVDVSTVVSSSAYQYAIIPCDANDELIISGIAGSAPRLWCFLDADNKVILNSSVNATADKLKLTIPLNTVKAVLNRNINNIPCYIGKTPKSTSDAVINFLDYYTNAKNAYMCNVLNKDTLIEGGYYNGNNVWVSNANLYATDYIPCKSGEVYSLNYSQDILLYDINKNYIGSIRTYSTKTRHAFKVPTYERPVCFFRAYGVIGQKETDGVYNSEEYIGNSKSIPYGNTYLVNPKTKNKIIHTFGDSRTWYDLNNYVEDTTTPGDLCIGYQSWMRRYLTTVVFNHGVSGYTTPQINTVVHNTNISNADVITLAGGINDFLHSTEIGTIQSIGGTFDTATVYGALQSMVEYILATKPDVKLMLINPFTGWLRNDEAEFPETYAKIKRDVAELYKLPLLDLTKICGFNSLNRDAFYCDDMSKVSYRLHLNNKGNEIIGQMISSFVSDGF